ncbi:MAG: hypothetical protein ACI9UA_005315, partial [Pseudoalteromonas tetraodonis]
DDALNELKEKTIRMGVIAQHNLKTSVMGILERDEARCNQVIANDEDSQDLGAHFRPDGQHCQEGAQDAQARGSP